VNAATELGFYTEWNLFGFVPFDDLMASVQFGEFSSFHKNRRIC